MIDIEVMKRAAEAAKKTCEQSGERWPTDEDWMEFQSTSAEADFVRQASPVAVLQLIARLHSAEARCAELQSHQDDYDRAHAGIEAAERAQILALPYLRTLAGFGGTLDQARALAAKAVAELAAK